MRYEKILPFEDIRRINSQFGFVPLSVIEPEKQSKAKWKDAYLDDAVKELKRSEDAKYLPGLEFSEFHAGLAENIVLYWSMVDSIIVDPFAGRATRAFVASKLGRKYYGYEISPTTVGRVKKHLETHSIGATIYNSNGCLMGETPDNFAHLVMTCPPYHDLEKYESVKGQLSDIKEYGDFLAEMAVTGKNIKRVLKPGGFVAWVCADWRSDGKFRSFHSDIIRMFVAEGLLHWDTIIIKNISPFASNQIGKVAAKRYTSKVHEYLLIFRKEGELEVSGDKIKNEKENKFFE